MRIDSFTPPGRKYDSTQIRACVDHFWDKVGYDISRVVDLIDVLCLVCSRALLSDGMQVELAVAEEHRAIVSQLSTHSTFAKKLMPHPVIMNCDGSKNEVLQ